MAKSNKELKDLKTLAHDLRSFMLVEDPRMNESQRVHADMLYFATQRLAISARYHEVDTAEMFKTIGQIGGHLTRYISNIDDNVKKHMLGAMAAGFMDVSGMPLESITEEITDESVEEDDQVNI